VQLWSQALPREGVKLPWCSRFIGSGGGVAAEARVELVLVDLRDGPDRSRLLRRFPEDLERALVALAAGQCPL